MQTIEELHESDEQNAVTESFKRVEEALECLKCSDNTKDYFANLEEAFAAAHDLKADLFTLAGLKS